MPRRPRHYLPGFPYHLVQRGNNKERCFLDNQDFSVYLNLWHTMANRYGVADHAYCLMPNHIHFLASPESECAISDAMRVIGSRYAQYFNRKYERTGTLWEGRHRASLVQNDRYLLTCYRYIELNPVRAGLVESPMDYTWSSVHANSAMHFGWLQPHPTLLALAATRDKAAMVYRGLLGSTLAKSDLSRIRTAIHYCQPLAEAGFIKHLESQFGLVPGRLARGRPRKVRPECC